jgi:gamma-glutamylcyclotransferase (GGCT)/AIG2-like uncharacterized protein YtfP
MSEPVTKRNLFFFFFGSLRSGYWNQRILSNRSHLIGPAETVDPFALYIGKHGTVPTCVPKEGSTPLKGEVWELAETDIPRVYMLETGYDHGTFPVTLKDGEIVEAVIFHHKDAKACYYMNGGPTLVPSGDYTLAVTKDGERIRDAA